MLVGAMSLCVQRALEHIFPAKGRFGRILLAPWLVCVSVAANGITAIRVGPVVVVANRVLRVNTIVAVEQHRSPQGIRRKEVAWLKLSSGHRVAVWSPPKQLSEMLSVPHRFC